MVKYSLVDWDSSNTFSDNESILVELPLPMMKGDVLFTLNRKNNTHYQVYKKIKNDYKQTVINTLNHTGKKFTRLNVYYKFYLTESRYSKKPDLDNISAMTKKFFNDAVKDIGLIDDDNVEYINRTTEEFVGISDKDKVVIEMVQVGDKTVAMWNIDMPKLTKKNTFEYNGEKFFYCKKDWNGKPSKMYHFYRYHDGMLIVAVHEAENGFKEIETKWELMKAKWNL